MEPINEHKGIVTPLNRKNVDTDQIIPKQFLKRIESTGFGQFLFYHWRFDEEGKQETRFCIKSDRNIKMHTILVAHENFGCGSSREHAPWALLTMAFKLLSLRGLQIFFIITA